MSPLVEPSVWRAAALSRQVTALGKIDSAVADLDVLIGALAGGGAAWDNLTPAQRTVSVRGMAQDIRALGLDYRRSLVELLDSP